MKHLQRAGLVICAAFVVFTAEAVNYNFAKSSSGGARNKKVLEEFEDMTPWQGPAVVQMPGAGIFMLASNSGSRSSVAPVSVVTISNGSATTVSGGGTGGDVTFATSGVKRGGTSAVSGNASFDFSVINEFATTIDQFGNTDIDGGNPDPEKLPDQGGSGGNEPWPPVGDGLLALLFMAGGYAWHIRRRKGK